MHQDSRESVWNVGDEQHPGARLPGFEFQLHPLQVVKLQPSYVTSPMQGPHLHTEEDKLTYLTSGCISHNMSGA